MNFTHFLIADVQLPKDLSDRSDKAVHLEYKQILNFKISLFRLLPGKINSLSGSLSHSFFSELSPSAYPIQCWCSYWERKKPLISHEVAPGLL